MNPFFVVCAGLGMMAAPLAWAGKASAPAKASAPGFRCVGKYVNPDGMSVELQKDGKVFMEFNGNKAECPATPQGEGLDINCGSGFRSAGEFSKDCKEMTFNGLTWKKQ